MSGKKNYYQQNLTAHNNSDSGGNLNESKDEVDFVQTASYTLNKDANHNSNNNILTTTTTTTTIVQRPILLPKKPQTCGGSLYGDCEMKNTIKSSLSTLEKLSFFTLHKKPINKTNIINNNNNNNISNNNNNNKSNNNLNNDGNNCQILTNFKSTLQQTNAKEHHHHHHHHHRPKFVKSASIARLLGNTYNTKKFEKELRKFQELEKLNGNDKNGSIHGVGGYGYTNGNNPERFHKCSKEDEDLNTNRINDVVNATDFHDNNNDNRDLLGSKAFRTISRGLGKLWWKRTQSVEISTPDPEYKVSYLGNVLTGWAKGDGCVEKPLNTLWRNYTQTNKPDVIMRVKVCASGLKATTRQHGLTEYWANRITHCCAPKNFPRVICWIYRHEGRKLKHELRCHAVLCAKESIAQEICNTLRENLDRALFDFKREKILKQNARLSLANAVYDNPSLPRRKILLSVGGNNYRPPLERSKSAPKLMAIEEAIGEEDGEEIEETNEPEMPSCCQKDSLYPAMTLGRRRCRKGHSIRRTGKGCQKQHIFNTFNSKAAGDCCNSKDNHLSVTTNVTAANNHNQSENVVGKANETENTGDDVNQRTTKTKSISSQCSNSDDDDLDKLLSYHDYDTNSPLAGELMTYFDMKLHKKTSSLTNLNQNEDEEVSFASTINTDPSPKLRPALSLDILDNCSEDDVGSGHCGDADGDDEEDDTDELFFRQTAILNLLHRNSLRKMANLSMSSDDSNSLEAARNGRPINLLDSDEGSISSGCETASTVTTNSINHQIQIKSQQQNNDQSLHKMDDEKNDVYNRGGSIKLCRGTTLNRSNGNNRIILRKQSDTCADDGSDSEFSDESGYVEYQQDKDRQTQSKTTTAV